MNGFHLKTKNLEIVPLTLDFLDTAYEYSSDRDLRYMLFLPQDSIEETKTFLSESEAEWQKKNPKNYECAVLCNGVHIGGISLTLDEKNETAELGWCLGAKSRGNGYALEAAVAIVHWAKEKLSISKFIAHCDSENAPSWMTMEKLGMKRVSCSGGRFNRATPKEERKEFTYELDLKNGWNVIDRFEMKNIPQIVETVHPLWRPDDCDDDFARKYVEFIVRNNIFSDAFSFELIDENRDEGDAFLSAAFFMRKGDSNDSRLWLEGQTKNLGPEGRIRFECARKYLDYMDEKTISLMGDADIKLSLFVSRKKGSGMKVISCAVEKLRRMGYRNIYLWTDSECNWQWYVNHGYELVNESEYEDFSSEDEKYMTYIFKKKI